MESYKLRDNLLFNFPHCVSWTMSCTCEEASVEAQLAKNHSKRKNLQENCCRAGRVPWCPNAQHMQKDVTCITKSLDFRRCCWCPHADQGRDLVGALQPLAALWPRSVQLCSSVFATKETNHRPRVFHLSTKNFTSEITTGWNMFSQQLCVFSSFACSWFLWTFCWKFCSSKNGEQIISKFLYVSYESRKVNKLPRKLSDIRVQHYQDENSAVVFCRVSGISQPFQHDRFARNMSPNTMNVKQTKPPVLESEQACSNAFMVGVSFLFCWRDLYFPFWHTFPPSLPPILKVGIIHHFRQILVESNFESDITGTSATHLSWFRLETSTLLNAPTRCGANQPWKIHSQTKFIQSWCLELAYFSQSAENLSSFRSREIREYRPSEALIHLTLHQEKILVVVDMRLQPREETNLEGECFFLQLKQNFVTSAWMCAWKHLCFFLWKSTPNRVESMSACKLCSDIGEMLHFFNEFAAQYSVFLWVYVQATTTIWLGANHEVVFRTELEHFGFRDKVCSCVLYFRLAHSVCSLHPGIKPQNWPSWLLKTPDLRRSTVLNWTQEEGTLPTLVFQQNGPDFHLVWTCSFPKKLSILKVILKCTPHFYTQFAWHSNEAFTFHTGYVPRGSLKPRIPCCGDPQSRVSFSNQVKIFRFTHCEDTGFFEAFSMKLIWSEILIKQPLLTDFCCRRERRSRSKTACARAQGSDHLNFREAWDNFECSWPPHSGKLHSKTVRWTSLSPEREWERLSSPWHTQVVCLMTWPQSSVLGVRCRIACGNRNPLKFIELIDTAKFTLHSNNK